MKTKEKGLVQRDICTSARHQQEVPNLNSILAEPLNLDKGEGKRGADVSQHSRNMELTRVGLGGI
jgi:hypothetical protein